MEMSPGESLLEQILRQARHDVIRAQSARVLDELAAQCTDLQLTAHWSCLNNGLQSSVRLGLTAAGYEVSVMIRISFYFKVYLYEPCFES